MAQLAYDIDELIILFDNKWKLNKNKCKKLINIYFQKYDIYINGSSKCTAYDCDCIAEVNLLKKIFSLNKEILIFFLNYCFEKKYIINDNKFQLFILNMINEIFVMNGLLNDNYKINYEWILINILHPEIIKNHIISNYSYIFNNLQIGIVDLIFNEYCKSGKKFIKRIFKYLDSIKFNYNNLNKKSLMTTAFESSNIFGIEQLYLRGVSVNSDDLHFSIKYEMIKYMCYIRYAEYNYEEILENPNLVLQKKNKNIILNPDIFDHENILDYNDDNDSTHDDEIIEYIDSDAETNIPNCNNKDYLDYSKLKNITYKLNLIIYNDEELIKIIFLNDKKLSNNKLDSILYELYMKILKMIYPNNYYDLDDIKYIINNYIESNKQSEKYYEYTYNLLNKLYEYGFVPTEKLINIYLNGCRLIQICHPDIHQKMLKIFTPIKKC